MKFKYDNRGVSLAMTVGLLLLLATLTATVSELVVQALRSAHRIEAADRAYFVAEAGVEDALYELSVHDAGYETAALGDPAVRRDDFDGSVAWNNEWQIAGRDTTSCDSMPGWLNIFTPQLCGRIYEGKRHIISLSSDDADSVGIGTNEINEASPDVNVPPFIALTIRFRLPLEVTKKYPGAFSAGLKIDNDRDYDPATHQGLNEDGKNLTTYPLRTCDYSGAVEVSDNDCDGREDEDSPQDPVLLWQLIGSDGNVWKPLTGCKLDPNDPSHNHHNSMLCESTFSMYGQEVYAEINQMVDQGTDETGSIMDLSDFISQYGADETLRLELFPAAPFEAIYFSPSSGEPDRIPFPYLEYGIEFTTDSSTMSSAHFAIRSDGYFQDFKQSITTNVTPLGATSLLDLTIIQQ